MTGSRRPPVVAIACGLALWAGIVSADGEPPVLTLRAAVVGEGVEPGPTLRIEVQRWSTEAERAPLLAALAAPAPAPSPAASPAAEPAAAAGAGRAGRAGAAGRGGAGGRGGARGGGAPATPQARLTAAVKAAPTVGFVWADGPSGYSIKYAWQSTAADGTRRVILATDRRIGAHQPLWPTPVPADADAEFTVIELHLDAANKGEAKTSLVSEVVADAAARTLVLGRYATAPVQLRVTK